MTQSSCIFTGNKNYLWWNKRWKDMLEFINHVFYSFYSFQIMEIKKCIRILIVIRNRKREQIHYLTCYVGWDDTPSCGVQIFLFIWNSSAIYLANFYIRPHLHICKFKKLQLKNYCFNNIYLLPFKTKHLWKRKL